MKICLEPGCGLIMDEQFSDDGRVIGHVCPDHKEHEIAALRLERDQLKRELEEARTLQARLKQEAEIQAQEARTHKATVHECYQIVTGGKGEPGDWHGTTPVRDAFERTTTERDAAQARVTQMAGEVCYALGINAPGEDAVKNWGQVLEQVTVTQAKVKELKAIIAPPLGEYFPPKVQVDGQWQYLIGIELWHSTERKARTASIAQALAAERGAHVVALRKVLIHLVEIENAPSMVRLGWTAAMNAAEHALTSTADAAAKIKKEMEK